MSDDDSIFRSGGQQHDMGPRPSISTAHGATSASDKAYQLRAKNRARLTKGGHDWANWQSCRCGLRGCLSHNGAAPDQPDDGPTGHDAMQCENCNRSIEYRGGVREFIHVEFPHTLCSVTGDQPMLEGKRAAPKQWIRARAERLAAQMLELGIILRDDEFEIEMAAPDWPQRLILLAAKGEI